MTQPICPKCKKSNYFKYKQIAHETSKFSKDLVVMVYCTNCGYISGIGAE